MLVVSGVSVLAAVFALLSYGWLAGIVVVILGAIAFALSRVFDLLGHLFAAVEWPETGTKPSAPGAGNATQHSMESAAERGGARNDTLG